MNPKFQLTYRLEVEDKFGQIQVIAFPLTIDFSIERNTMAGYNTAEFTVFNLADNLRSLLVRNNISFSDRRSINFYAGYVSQGPNLPLVFSGYVQNCVSNRDTVDWMTTFSCFDPDPITRNKNISVSYAAGSFQSGNIQDIVNTYMAPVTFGKIGNLFQANPTLPRGNSYSGSALSILRKITNKNFFIDNGKAYVLAPWECLPNSGLEVLDATTGLLGSPSYEQTYVNCKMIFEPRIVMAQQMELNSDQSYLNGTFKVVAFGHNGRISGSSGGEAITTVSLYNPLNSQGLQVLQ